jgi:hypothetical protein
MLGVIQSCIDADIFGPSLPTMMKVNHVPELGADNRMLPVSNYGIKCMSIGLLVTEHSYLSKLYVFFYIKFSHSLYTVGVV